MISDFLIFGWYTFFIEINLKPTNIVLSVLKRCFEKFKDCSRKKITIKNDFFPKDLSNVIDQDSNNGIISRELKIQRLCK